MMLLSRDWLLFFGLRIIWVAMHIHRCLSGIRTWRVVFIECWQSSFRYGQQYLDGCCHCVVLCVMVLLCNLAFRFLFLWYSTIGASGQRMLNVGSCSIMCQCFRRSFRMKSAYCESFTVGPPKHDQIGLPGMLGLCILGSRYSVGVLVVFSGDKNLFVVYQNHARAR